MTGLAAEVANNQQVIADFRAGRENLSGVFPRSALLLLTTTGARSGEQRTWPVVKFVLGGRLAVVGSAAGREQHPAWYHNLVAQPRVGVEQWDGDTYETFTAHAEIAGDEDYEPLWAQVVAQNPAFSGYRTMTARRMPIVHLDRD